MKNILKTLSILVLLCVLIQCKPMPNSSSGNEKTFIVASQTVDCTGVAPMKCLQVKEKESDSWEISTATSKDSPTNQDLNMF